MLRRRCHCRVIPLLQLTSASPHCCEKSIHVALTAANASVFLRGRKLRSKSVTWDVTTPLHPPALLWISTTDIRHPSDRPSAVFSAAFTFSAIVAEKLLQHAQMGAPAPQMNERGRNEPSKPSVLRVCQETRLNAWFTWSPLLSDSCRRFPLQVARSAGCALCS